MKTISNRPRLVIAVNSSIALGFLQGQPEYFQSSGFDVTVLCPEKRTGEWDVERPENVKIVQVPIERGIAPFQDLRSAWQLCRILRSLRPTVTNVGTPKAGLLGGFAAWLTRVPCRFYTLHGLRFETTAGLRRKLLMILERLACRFAHRVVCVSNSVRRKAIALGLVDRQKAVVFGAGSCNGVDIARYEPTPERNRKAAELRTRFGIPADAPVALFVGRLTRDKGICELLRAFQQIENRLPRLRLLLVGSYEEGDPLPPEIREQLEAHERVILTGPVNDPAPYYALADVLILPSHREGLPTVVLEGQAAGKPVIGASATGIVDLLVDNETGLLFPIGDAPALAEAIGRLVEDKLLARKLALAGQEQVKRNFRQELIWAALRREYLKVLQGVDAPRARVLPQHEN
jgi:glycosyltransferase involved in cell wall biosynthesis